MIKAGRFPRQDFLFLINDKPWGDTIRKITATITEVVSLIGKTAKDAGDVVTANEESCSVPEGIARTVRDLMKGNSQKTEIMRTAKA
jgi:hypothetical protein